MDIEYTDIALDDLAAGTANITLDEEFAYVEKVQQFAAGAAAVGTDLPLVYAAPAAGQVEVQAPNKLVLGTASAAGDMYVARIVRANRVPQI